MHALRSARSTEAQTSLHPRLDIHGGVRVSVVVAGSVARVSLVRGTLSQPNAGSNMSNFRCKVSRTIARRQAGNQVRHAGLRCIHQRAVRMQPERSQHAITGNMRASRQGADIIQRPSNRPSEREPNRRRGETRFMLQSSERSVRQSVTTTCRPRYEFGIL